MPKIYCLNFKDNDKVAKRGAVFSAAPRFFFKAPEKGEVSRFYLLAPICFSSSKWTVTTGDPCPNNVCTRALGNGLFEVRAKAEEGIGRVFFCTMAGRKIIILHSFIKKTDKSPKRELDLALTRQKEVINNGL